MDARGLDANRFTHMSGTHLDPRLPGLRRFVATATAVVVRLGTGGAGGAADTRQRLLLAYTAGSILLGLALLAWTTVAVPVAAGIDPGLAGTTLQGTQGGLYLAKRAGGGVHLYDRDERPPFGDGLDMVR